MGSLNFSLLLLLISPALILTLHIITSQAVRYLKWQGSAQKLALVCIVLGNLPLGLLEWVLVLRYLNLVGQFWGAVYCILTYNAIGHVYFHLFNMTETSIRVRLLREIDAQDQTIDEVIDRYNPSNSVGVRLQRLQEIGVVKQTGGRYFLQSQWLYYVGIVCRAWGVLLGFNEKDNGYITQVEKKKSNNASTNSGIRYLVLASLILICFIPIIIFYARHDSFVAAFNESLAYRYFFVYRMVNGEINPHLWLPQGFLTTSIQKLVFIIESQVISPQTQLELSLEVFGYLTFIAHGLIAALLLFSVMRDNRLEIFQKVCIVLSLFIPIYAIPGSIGSIDRSYYTQPDYYSLNIVLSAGFLYYFFLFSVRRDQEISLKMIGIIAFLSGISASNKISLIFLAAALVILLGVRFIRQPLFVLYISLISTAAFILGMLLPWLISHHPNYGVGNIGEYLKLWVGFVQNAPQEGGLMEVLKNNPFPIYTRFVCVYVLFLIFFLVHIFRRYTVQSQQFLISTGILILAILQSFISLNARSAGTTMFETFTILTSFTMMIVGTIQSKEQYLNWTRWGFVLMCSIIMVTHLSRSAFYFPARNQDELHLPWKIHNFALSYRLPVIVVIPDNSFNYGAGIEELLLKGFSDFPTWNITAGKKMLQEFAPGFSYRSDYSEQKPDLPYPTGVVIMWFDKTDSIYEKATSLIEAYPELKKVLATSGTDCHQWFIKGHDRVVNICAVP